MLVKLFLFLFFFFCRFDRTGLGAVDSVCFFRTLGLNPFYGNNIVTVVELSCNYDSNSYCCNNHKVIRKFCVFEMVRFNVSLYVFISGHPKKVKQLPSSKTEEEEKIPAEKEKDVEQELRPPSRPGHEKDEQLKKESTVTGLENVMTLFSAKVR